MKCLNCGYCCIELDVIIIWPIDENIKNYKNINEISIEYYKHKKSHFRCPCLRKKNDRFICDIHNYDWYKNTPCFNHSQIERKNKNCRIGEYMLNNKDIYSKILNFKVQDELIIKDNIK